MKFKKKKLVLFFLAIGAWTGAMSQDVGYIMRVNLVNGTVDEYLVADHPRVSFIKDSLFVSSAVLSANYAVDDVANYTFVDTNSTYIEEVYQKNDNLNVSVKFIDGETVEIRGIETDASIAVYAIDGRKQNATVVFVDDGVNVSLSALPSGAYIITIKNGKSVKVLKR